MEVDRRPLAVGAVALGHLGFYAMAGEVGEDRGFVPGMDAEADMIDVAPFAAGRRAAHRSELAVDGHQVDQARADAKLIEADFRLVLLEGCPEDVSPEGGDPLQVDHPENDMVYVADSDHASSALTPGNSLPSIHSR